MTRLEPGSRLGVFEIVGLLGAGGMGEVYRAHDPRLRRDVALKILPANVAADHQRLARFEREAQVLAALNHPHIAAIYGIEDAGARTVWAFGCVLYEMLTGRAAFAGETFTDTLARVLEREPDWNRLLATTPASIRRLLRRCLEKDPRRRLRDIGDARLEPAKRRRPARKPQASTRLPADGARPLSWRWPWRVTGRPVAGVCVRRRAQGCRTRRWPCPDTRRSAEFCRSILGPGMEPSWSAGTT